MSLSITVFDSRRGFVASEGRVSCLQSGKVIVTSESTRKHLQLDAQMVVAVGGVATIAVAALELAQNLKQWFGNRCADFVGGLKQFFTNFVEKARCLAPNGPVPLGVLILSKDQTSKQITCFLTVAGRESCEFHVPDGAAPKIIVGAPPEITAFVNDRLCTVLPPIFKSSSDANFARECEAVVKAVVADAAKQDERINADVRFAFIGGSNTVGNNDSIPTLTGTAAAWADLLTAIVCAGVAEGAVTVQGALTIPILFSNAETTGTADASAVLSVGAGFASSIVDTATAQGALTTEILLQDALTEATATALGVLMTDSGISSAYAWLGVEEHISKR